jgi:hypothetical protein
LAFKGLSRSFLLIGTVAQCYLPVSGVPRLDRGLFPSNCKQHSSLVGFKGDSQAEQERWKYDRNGWGPMCRAPARWVVTERVRRPAPHRERLARISSWSNIGNMMQLRVHYMIPAKSSREDITSLILIGNGGYITTQYARLTHTTAHALTNYR